MTLSFDHSILGKNLKIELLDQQQVELKDPPQISFYNTGLTNEFERISVQQNSSKDLELENLAHKQTSAIQPAAGALNAKKKSNENPLMRHFRRKFEMQKCSSASHILKVPFNNNRISLSPIHNSKKLLNHQDSSGSIPQLINDTDMDNPVNDTNQKKGESRLSSLWKLNASNR